MVGDSQSQGDISMKNSKSNKNLLILVFFMSFLVGRASA